jgi:hypothetical protein
LPKRRREADPLFFSLPDPPGIAISTEAAHSFIVSRAAEKSASLLHLCSNGWEGKLVTLPPIAFAF